MANTIKLRKGMQIGHPDAESDEDFLNACFVNNGSFDSASDIESRQCILLGRTGSGKSAIIHEIKRWKRNVIDIAPESLALHNVANSQIINFFEGAGVHLDGFYVLLWKHIFSVELLKRKFKIDDERGQSRFFASLADICRKDKSKETAVNYLRDWGEKFWIETEYRTADFTTKLETRLEGGLQVGHEIAHLGIKGAQALNEKQKIEVLHHGQRAVSGIQIRELAKVVELLAEDIFPPGAEEFYICIDRLDEDWVQDNIRFKLLKALVETIKAFQQVRAVKIIITMRTDLMYSLRQRIDSPGFQSEKYSSYYLNLKWTRQELAEMLNRRVSYLFEHQYSGQDVKLHEIIPVFIGAKIRTIDYIVDRTFFRPREAISFLNKCFEKADGHTMINAAIIKDAEYLYSEERLTALCDEWRREYPNLRKFSNLLRGFSEGSEVGHFRDSKLEAFCLSMPKTVANEEADLANMADDAAMDAIHGGLPFLRLLLSILYRTGLIGLKLSTTTTPMFSFHNETQVNPEHIELTTRVYVHKAFWISLGIRTSEFDTRSLRP